MVRMLDWETKLNPLRMFRVAKAVIVPVLVAIGGTATAQDFPGKPVRFITGAAPGSSGDVLARVLGDRVSEVWKQPVVIENRPGAGGAISSQAVLSAPADGHTVFIAAGSYLTITPATTANLPYDVDRDFTPLAFLAEIPLVIGGKPRPVRIALGATVLGVASVLLALSTSLPLSLVADFAQTRLSLRISTVEGVAQGVVYGAQHFALRGQLSPR